MKEYHSNRSKIFVAKTDGDAPGRVVGYFCAWFVEEELHILNLASHPLFRRRKVATGLLSHCLAFSSARGVKWAFLEVRQSNEQALSLYGRHGFKPVGRRKHVGDIRGRGLFWGLELVAERASKRPFDPKLRVHARLKREALNAGLMCYPMGGTLDGVQGDHVLLAPPFIVEEAQLDELVAKLGAALDAVLKVAVAA